MANPEHLSILKQGVEIWNKWREEHEEVAVDLSEANLSEAHLRKANLRKANLRKAKLMGANLAKANLMWASLPGANLTSANLAKAVINKATLNKAILPGAVFGMANLPGADFTEADLRGANFALANLKTANFTRANLAKATFINANLRGANLNEANLEGANLYEATLTKVNFERATLINCKIYGASVWNVNLKETKQSDLIITPQDEPEITVDNLEVAQFIYLLLDNENVRKVIDTITSKVVLILGRFTPERKKVLDALKAELRQRNYSPVLFDFDKPASKDLTGTVETLARMARFIIADLTDPSSIPHELATVVPFLRTTPVQPLRLAGTSGYSMFNDFTIYPWVLETFLYETSDHLISSLREKVIGPAEAKVQELTKS